ncbi:MAG TPA: 6-phosphogluconolactonase [Lysobacter sp.]|nr:6-phosphogluconolactonase [Lysobacter sp.]
MNEVALWNTLPMSATATPRQQKLETPEMVWHTFSDVDAWRWASAVAIAAELRRDLQQQARARLLLSGGSTPAPVYRALAKAPLEWDRIDVALVDERWVLPDDPDSNARLVRTELLTHHAASARFEPMTQPGRTIEQAVAVANAHGRQPASVIVLGMGEDGHTASLFPHMPGLPVALASAQPYVAVDASGCAGAGRWPRRISLTPAGLRMGRARLLLIRGPRKRELLAQALASRDVLQWPVLAAFDETHQVPLQVYWCP